MPPTHVLERSDVVDDLADIEVWSRIGEQLECESSDGRVRR